MEIYIVQQGDTITSIADKYGVTVEKLIQDNGLSNPYNLVIGQAIVIAYPKQTHTVLQGDTLQTIADTYQVSVMQLLRNNPFLSERQYIYPGETLVISYNTKGSITMNGFAYPYIKQDTLLKILPNLTYISILNYTTAANGDIITYQDDTDVINKSKEYGVIPLMVITTLSLQGEPNYEAASSILQSQEYQDILIDNAIKIMKEKGYYGVNFIFNYLSEDNQSFYLNFTERIANRIRQEGLFFLTINYDIPQVNNEVVLLKINYTEFSKYANGLVFLEFVWGTNYGPPEPVCNMYHIETLVEYLIESQVPADKIIMGKPIIGYEWRLPYIPGKTIANSLTLYSAYNLAYDYSAVIEFDEESQTPYFYYDEILIAGYSQHIVWFLDARSINALDTLIVNAGLNGGAIWNMMIYYPQLWVIIYSQYEIIKIEM
jgi:spore germination protein